MYKISDFNSLWEIGFAINAIFVFFDLQPLLKKKFKSTQSLGSSEIDKYILKEDQRYVNTYGWRTLVVNYGLWLSLLKLSSIICSLLSLVLIIAGGFNPEFSFGWFTITLLIIIEFAPIVFIPYIILISLPKYKLMCIDEALKNLISKKKSDNEFIKKHMKQYKFLVDYIMHFDHSFLLLINKRKKVSMDEVFDIFHQ